MPTGARVDLNDPQVWTKRIQAARDYREHRAAELGWKRCADAVRGKILEDEPLQDTVVVNFPYAYVAQMLPTVYYTQPRIRVRETREADRLNAQAMESALNYECRRLRIERPMRRIIKDALTIGTGYGKLGWATTFGEIPPTADTKVKRKKTSKPRLHQRRQGLRPGQPFFYRVSPEHMFCDPYATCWEEVRWVAQSYFAPYDWILSDPYLENKDKVTPGWTLQQDLEAGQGMLMQRMHHRVDEPLDEHHALLYEIWDLDTFKVRILAEGSDRWQRVESHPYRETSDGLPFLVLTTSVGDEDWFGTSAIHMFLDQVREISKIRTKQLDHIYRMPGKVLGPRGAFTDEEVEKMRDPDEHFVTCGDPDRVKDFAALRPDPNMYIVEDRAKQDIEHISGFSELSLGAVPGGRTTATVGMIAARASGVRVKQVIDGVKEFLLETASKLSGLIALFAPESYHIRVSGDRGAEWVTIRRDQLQGEFFFDFDVTEMAPISREMRQKEAIELFTLLAQVPEIRRRRLVQDTLEAYGKAEESAYLQPDLGNPVDPAYENALMLRGTEVLPNPAEDFALHLEVHNAFLEQPEVGQILTQAPAIRNQFSAHIQLTLQLARQVESIQAAAQSRAGGASPGPTAAAGSTGPGPGMSQLQRGRPLATSQAPYGQRGEG